MREEGEKKREEREIPYLGSWSVRKNETLAAGYDLCTRERERERERDKNQSEYASECGQRKGRNAIIHKLIEFTI